MAMTRAKLVSILFIGFALLSSWRLVKDQPQKTQHVQRQAKPRLRLENTTRTSVRASVERNAINNGTHNETRNIVTRDEEVETTTDTPQPMPKLTDARPTKLRLLMVGDSVTRYHYLSLTHFLLHGKWIDEDPEHQRFQNGTTLRNPINERTYPNWETFFRETHMAGYEVCDCYRADGRLNRGTVSENRYFYDPKLDNMVAMVQVFDQPQGYEDPETIFARVQEFQLNSTNYAKSPFHWRYRRNDGYADVIRHVARKLSMPPTHALLNRGLWPGKWFSDPSRRIDLLQALQGDHERSNSNGGNNTEQAPILGIWRTTTCWANRRITDDNDDEVMTEFFRNHSQLVLDASWSLQLKRDQWWDGTHFWEPIYRIWSEELLTMMGHIFPPQYAKLDRDTILM